MRVKGIEVENFKMLGLEYVPLRNIVGIKRSKKNSHVALFEYRENLEYSPKEFFIIANKSRQPDELITPLGMVLDKLA